MSPEIFVKHHTLDSGLRLEVASRGRGSAVLFLHGYTDSWRSFEAVLRELPDSVTALAPSQRGHGRSERPATGYLATDMARDAVELLDALWIERACVVGHSMGSTVAQELALSHPDRVSKLVLVGGATTFDNPLVHELAQVIDAFEDAVPPAFVEEFQRSTLHRPVTEDLLRTVVAESLKVPAHVWQQALRAQIAFRSEPRLARIDVPTLLVWGDRDAITLRSEQDRLLRGIRGSTLRCYEDTGHAPHWEQPERFARDVTEFATREFTTTASSRPS